MLTTEQKQKLSLALQAGDIDAAWALIHDDLPTRVTAPLRFHTLNTYRAGIRPFHQYLKATEEPLAEVPDLEMYARWLREQGYKVTSARAHVTAAKVILRALFDVGLAYQQQVTRRSPRAQRRQEERESATLPHTEAELEKLTKIAIIDEKLLIFLATDLGLTVAEVVDLKKGDFEEEGSRYVLNLRRGQVQGLEAPTDRMLLPPRVAAAYLRWIRYRPAASEQVFLGATRQALHQKLLLLSQKAEVPYQGYQGLRLAGARRVYQDSRDLKAVAAFLRVSLSQVRRYVRAGILS